MAVSKIEVQKYGILGAVASLAVPWIMGWAVIPILNALAGVLPGFTATLAAGSPGMVTINVRQALQIGLQASPIGSYIFGLTKMTIPAVLITAVGGAAVFIAGAYLADMIGIRRGTAGKRLAAVIFAGTLVASLLVTATLPTLGLGFVNTLIAFGINALVLGYVIVFINDTAKLNIVP